MEIGSFGILASLNTWYSALLMGVLASMSIYMLALIVVRVRFFRSIRGDAHGLVMETQEALEKNDEDGLNRLRGHQVSDPPVRILLRTAVSNRRLEGGDLGELLKITIIRQRDRLERGLPIFGTFAAIGPFLGLLATVLGIIHSFEALALSGAAGPNVVASGVAEALWGTAAGLVVAIPSVVAYNIFNKKAKGLMTELEVTAREIMVVLRTLRPKSGKS